MQMRNEILLRGVVASVKRVDTTGTGNLIFTLQTCFILPQCESEYGIIESSFFSCQAYEAYGIDASLIKNIAPGDKIELKGRVRTVCYVDSERNGHKDYIVIIKELKRLDLDEDLEFER